MMLAKKTSKNKRQNNDGRQKAKRKYNFPSVDFVIVAALSHEALEIAQQNTYK